MKNFRVRSILKNYQPFIEKMMKTVAAQPKVFLFFFIDVVAELIF